jgi:hypothetical protein
MSLRRRISSDEFTELPAHQAEDYAEQDGGDYALMVIGDDGNPTPIEPTEDVSGLKSAHEKNKGELPRLKERVRDERAALASGDAAAVRKLRQKQLEESEQRLAQIAIDRQAALNAKDAEYTPKFAELGVKLEASLAEGDKLVLDYELANVIRAAGGVVELLAPKLERFCRVVRDPETGARRVGVFTDDGIERIDPATGLPVTPATALAELRLFDPRLAPAFNNNGSAPTGS